MRNVKFLAAVLAAALMSAPPARAAAANDSAAAAASISAGPLPLVLGDRGQLVQLFQNLLANSIMYREASPPQIRVTSELGADAMWTISVADNGIGIDPQYQEQIFRIFGRLHGKDVPGTGIGLALCKKLIERSGGSIWLQSADGEGSTFFFTVRA